MKKPGEKIFLRIVSGIALLFGLLTLKSGGSVLFGPESATLAAGHVVDFVLWFNFLAGFLYVITAIGLWRGKIWAVWLAGAIALMTVLVFIAFGGHILNGGLYENRTIAAMTLRLTLWTFIFFFARKHIAGRA